MWVKNKHIIKEFDEYILKHDLIGFQETKLSTYDEVHIENYEIFTKIECRGPERHPVVSL